MASKNKRKTAQMKILIRHYLCPGDVLMLTAAVRDLKKAHPYLEINVETSAMELWDNNPYLNRSINENNADKIINAEYPLINQSDSLPYHFIHAFRKELQLHLGLNIPQGDFKPDIHLSDEEKQPLPELENIKRYWLVDAGYKTDFTLKNWGLSRYQQVIDFLSGSVNFVQIGENHPQHVHKKLNNVFSMVGKTAIRQFIRLMYNASGVLTPVSFPMHLSAAIPMPDGRIRPCVVIAGAREPAHWEQYPGHTFLSNVGMFDCCRNKSCWKSRAQKLNDGSDCDESICQKPFTGVDGECVGTCMAMIDPAVVALTIKNFESFC
jgi:ADP-heptose:LPS heptosyltransferase